ncbi:MAG: CPBP family intramembrane metalloprotease [Parachlamydiaceae bacterium]|nr:CPBP family intramembrane metalloprotease [Parachlamydiaceae bacterium]
MSTVNAEVQQNQSYVNSFINHPITIATRKMICGGVIEICSTVAATAFLYQVVVKRMLNPLASHTYRNSIPPIVVVGPVLEEVLFRQLLQGSLHMVQRFNNRFIAKKPPSHQDLKIQEHFRVTVTAVIFGGVHLQNSHKNVFSAVKQFSLATLGGFSYGYLAEKYNTISLSILAHGINNAIAVLPMIYLNKSNRDFITLSCITSMVALKILCIKLGTSDDIQNKVKSLANDAKTSVANMIEKVNKKFSVAPVPVSV